MDRLAQILEHKRRDVAGRRAGRPSERLVRPDSAPLRDFAAALRSGAVAVIAEIKRRSPSQGVLRPELDPAEMAREYERHGAAALSVLTEARFFGGSDADLRAARAAVELPVLRKDFVVDEYQIREAWALGADAVLLIVRALTEQELGRFLELAGELGLAALVEVHTEVELKRALACGASIIGVNSRDLSTFAVGLDAALRLRDRIPAGRTAVAESGIASREDVLRLVAAGYEALLVGEALLRAPHPGRKLAELLGAEA